MGLVALVTAACAQPSREAAPVPAPAVAQQHAAGLQSVLVSSQLVVGRERLAIGVLDANTPVKGDGLEGKGVYVAYVSFGAPGPWLAEITARKASGPESVSRMPVTVATTSPVPFPGQPAPRSRNLTRGDVPDLSYIDSGVPPDDMHALSIADAIGQQRPTLIVFATPAFCTSAMCGPEVHAVQQLEPAYRARVAFIHVEIYQDFKPDPSKMTLTPTVLEWRLQTEPWVFLVDATGTVRYAFEGPTATDELRTALDAMLASR